MDRAAGMKAVLAVFVVCATARCQDGIFLLYKMQQALGGADRIEQIRDLDQLVRAETWDHAGRRIGQRVSDRKIANGQLDITLDPILSGR